MSIGNVSCKIMIWFAESIIPYHLFLDIQEVESHDFNEDEDDCNDEQG